MEFAILTQNKEMIVPFTHAIDIEKMHGSNCCNIYTGTILLGSYRDMDRAKQVIDDICSAIYSRASICAMPKE